MGKRSAKTISNPASNISNKSDLMLISVAMFSRWSQENYFRYMRQEYNLDALIDYKVEEIDGTKKAVNPKYR